MFKLDHLPDDELLKMFQEGSESAFEEIHSRYFKRLYLHAHKMLNDPEAAQDVVQEVFIKFWLKSESLQIRVELSAYLYTATRNCVLNTIEQQNVYHRHLNALGQFLQQPGADILPVVADEAAFYKVFEAEISNLPSKMKVVFELRRKDELSYQQIAGRLSISDKTVKKQISNAIKILKSRLLG